MSGRPSDELTHVELIWRGKRNEHWIRFGRDVAEQILDRQRRIPPTPKLIWNGSASVPMGLYAVQPAGVLHATELVVIRPPGPASWVARKPGAP
jgi:hypothetical protein